MQERVIGFNELLRLLRVAGDGDNRVVVLGLHRYRAALVLFQCSGQCMPVKGRTQRSQARIHADLAGMRVAERIAEHGQPGRVRPALGHADEHGRHPPP